ncbi:hypothetical protein SVAN01_01763 [Stagonosporopsis vannaccii]|nr:hypothetical protein SVAN01_01763 [Stagonosporopsis vannaccii]
MSKPEDELRPFSLEEVCAADRSAKRSYICINVGRDSKGRVVPSLERLQRKAEKCLTTNKKPVTTSTKLYIFGDWIAAVPKEGLSENKQNLADAKEWNDGVDAVRKLIRAMGYLRELVWIGGLPFMASVFDDLPVKMTKLVLDLGNHVRVLDDSVRVTKLHINPEDMRPLMKQTRLQELRLFRLRDSLQFIAWQTVYLNDTPEGMRTLELQMDAEPILRNKNNKYHKAVDVRGLTVAQPGLLEKPNKGRDGKGGLHWTFGYGEYLDSECIRKARIASGLEKPRPLPLQSLKLDGFVIDHLPFECELKDITLLTCGDKCIDAGMRAPKTHAKPYHVWSKHVNHAACHFYVQWPNWSGIFDTAGDQRDTHGDVDAQGAGLSMPYTEDAPVLPLHLPLTEKTLNMKGIDDALNDIYKPDYFNISPSLPGGTGPDTPLSDASDIPERGSRILTPTELSDGSVEGAPAMDDSITSDLSPEDSSDIVYVNGASDSLPEVSLDSSSCNSNFGIGALAHKHKVRKSLSDSYWVLGPS